MHNQKGLYAICETLNAYIAQSKKGLMPCEALNAYNAQSKRALCHMWGTKCL